MDGYEKLIEARKKRRTALLGRRDLEFRRALDKDFAIYSRLYLSEQIGIDEVPVEYRPALLNYETETGRTAERRTEPQPPAKR